VTLALPNSDSVGKFDDRDRYSGLIRFHVLHHAAEGPIFGLGMVEEVARHGYRISPGTLYPIRGSFAPADPVGNRWRERASPKRFSRPLPRLDDRADVKIFVLPTRAKS